jgi:hypothetical protein
MQRALGAVLLLKAYSQRPLWLTKYSGSTSGIFTATFKSLGKIATPATFKSLGKIATPATFKSLGKIQHGLKGLVRL